MGGLGMATHVVVVGGGVTGLVAARRLREQGVAVTLVERGFPFGGRLRPDEVEIPGYGRAVFDPHPVFLGADRYDPGRSDAPLGLPPLALRAGDRLPGLADLARRVPVVHLSAGGDDTPNVRVTVAGGARGLIDLLLPPGYDPHLTLLGRTEVTALEPIGPRWRVRVRECGPPDADPGPARTLPADAVLLTQPVPQAIELLDGSGVACPDPVRDELRAVRYARGLALLAAFRGPSRLPPGGLVSFADSPVSLLSDNHATGASPAGPAITAVVDTGWAAEHWDEPDEEIARRLLPLVVAWAGGEVVWHRVRRTEYAQATSRPRMPFTEASASPPLVLAGGAFAGYVPNPLDAALTSATHAATHLCRSLGRVARAADRPSTRTPARAVLDVAVAAVEEAAAAVGRGADRLLLLAAPEVGGLTPSLDLFLGVRRVVKRVRETRGQSIPVTVLLRPRLGDCDYTRAELDQMRRDARRFLRAGAGGIAFGAVRALGPEVRVDAAGCRSLVALARQFRQEAVFHRAFDALTDRRTGLQDLIALGFHRVVTAGRWGLALDALGELAADVGYAGWDIEVAAAGGITPETVGCVVRHTGCRHVLAGLRQAVDEPARNRWVPGCPARRAFRPGWVSATAAVLQRVAEEDFADGPTEGEVGTEQTPTGELLPVG
jgi:copper homeostasis protein CutC/predicted NAD/FAD-dependent oxidoreductase